MALVLIGGLTIYMYSICNNYLHDLIDDELNNLSSFAKQQSKKSTVDIVNRLQNYKKEIA